ncbi:hypothetical protein ACH4TX_04535 [Streptomyces sp. NPDC021098]|uniref:hypothetical protein n=1 Tax=unclassified Streptomyces TaxID=2593676 RepID=UPI00379F45EB
MSNAGVAMAGRQLPAAIEEFASYLRALTRRIDPEQGWYAVFAQRDPEGLRACLAGEEIPPWDVVQALLQDLSAQRGAQTANVAAARAATLYRASITAHDAAPGTREALSARLAAMRRERLAAADREHDLEAAQRAGAETTPDGDPVDAALAWAQDDHHRATARCEELTARLAALPPPPGAAPGGPPAAGQPFGGAPGPGLPGAGPVSWGTGGPRGPSAAGPAGQPRPGGARSAPLGEGPLSAIFGGPSAPGAPGASPGPQAGEVSDAVGAWTVGGSQGRPSAAGPDGSPPPGGAGSVPLGEGPLSAVFGGPSAPGAPGAGQRPSGGEAGPGPRGEGSPPPGAARSSWALGGLQDPSAAGLGARRQEGDAEDAPPPEGAPPRPRGARFAAAYDGGPEPGPGAAAEPPARPRGARFAGAGAAPRGGRFGGRGGARKREREAEERARASEQQELAEARRAAGEAVARLGRLRAEGRSGEAHAVLCETAVWSAVRLPVLAAELERAGLGADVATLLWEMSSLPPERLAAAAEALVAAGREADGERLLRQSVARPAPEVAQTALALLGNAAHSEVALLLAAFIRARTPAEVAEAAAEEPGALVPPLLEAASAVSPGSQHDLAHALRVAGIPGAG